MLNAIPDAPVDLTAIIAQYFPGVDTVRREDTPYEDTPYEDKSFFQKLNAAALEDLGAWVPLLFPEAVGHRSGYRVSSHALGRDLEEDLSIHAEGIIDFGVHDMGDEREGKRTALELIMEHGGEDLAGIIDASKWLCQALGIGMADLGWSDDPAQPLSPSEFDMVEGFDDDELPPFQRNKAGEILATLTNVRQAVKESRVVGLHVAFDEFTDSIMLSTPGQDDWRPFKDTDYTELRLRLEHIGFKPVARDMVRDAVHHVADSRSFDSAILWLESLPWDGVKRIGSFLPDYFGTEDSAYTRSVSEYIWTALAGRVMEPGIKADMMPVFIGKQGVGKSTGVEAMVPSQDHFFEVDLATRENDLSRVMRGRLLGEVSELRGLHSKEIEHIKAFITRTHEKWIPKYAEFATNFPRRCLLIGTANRREFLSDDSGERRFLPIDVGNVDVPAIKAVHAQLWAEARERFLAVGVQWEKAKTLAAPRHADYKLTDTWEEPILAWLETEAEFTDEDGAPRTNGSDGFLMSDLLAALGIPVKDSGMRQMHRIGSVLRGLGYDNRARRVDGKLVRVWGKVEE